MHSGVTGEQNMNAPLQGTVYLVGAGPGDPGLVTVRGYDMLRRADVVLHDTLSPPELLAACRPEAQLIDVGKVPGQRFNGQETIHALMIREARRGRTVVRLKGGDPFVFGRGLEELRACRRAGISCVVIPGISSALAIPAVVGVSVTHRGVSRSFAVITGRTKDRRELPDHDYTALAAMDTVVLLMGRSNLKAITDALIAHGKHPETPAVAVAAGTTPQQQVVNATLATIAAEADRAALKHPVTTVIGETAAFARQQMAWYPTDRLDRPLYGRRIALTQAVTSTSELRGRLASLGARIVDIPLIRVEYPDRAPGIDGAIRRLRRFNWILFTSVHAVRGFWRRLDANGLDARALGNCAVAAVGPGTARELRGRGVIADLVPRAHHSAGLHAKMAPYIVPGETRILLPQGNQSLPHLRRALLAAGAGVCSGVVYETRAADLSESALGRLRQGVDVVVFCSPTAVRRFHELALDGGASALFACIGETTARAARACGCRVDILPDRSGTRGLVEALRCHFSSRAPVMDANHSSVPAARP
jgi:uroporphyrinogen III methyltransferase/synthase